MNRPRKTLEAKKPADSKQRTHKVFFFFVFVMFRDSWPWLIQKSPGVIINRVVVTVKCLENKVYDYMFLQVVLKVVLFLYFYS